MSGHLHRHRWYHHCIQVGLPHALLDTPRCLSLVERLRHACRRRLEPGAVSMLGMMSPVTAVILGWVVLGQSLSPLQGLGAAIVLGSVCAGQRANRSSTETTPVLPNPSPAKVA